VPKLQAVKNIVINPESFGLRLPPLENHPYFLSVPIDRDIDVELAARLAKLSVAEFKTLNPQMNKPVILAAGTPQILLPYDNANLFVRNLAAHRGAMASWTAWVAPKTIRPTDAAKQWQWTESALREINRIPPKMLIKAGSTLLVPRQSESPERVAEHIVDNALISLAPEPPPLRRMTVRTQPKDTLTSVAHRYQVQPEQITQWNKIPAQGHLKTGQTLIVYVPHSFKLAKAPSPPRSTDAKRQPVKVADSRKSGSAKRGQTVSSTSGKSQLQTSGKVRVASTR
jgi:membrane-bound lytic murein transglycosylase D